MLRSLILKASSGLHVSPKQSCENESVSHPFVSHSSKRHSSNFAQNGWFVPTITVRDKLKHRKGKKMSYFLLRERAHPLLGNSVGNIAPYVHLFLSLFITHRFCSGDTHPYKFLPQH